MWSAILRRRATSAMRLILDYVINLDTLEGRRPQGIILYAPPCGRIGNRFLVQQLAQRLRLVERANDLPFQPAAVAALHYHDQFPRQPDGSTAFFWELASRTSRQFEERPPSLFVPALMRSSASGPQHALHPVPCLFGPVVPQQHEIADGKPVRFASFPTRPIDRQDGQQPREQPRKVGGQQQRGNEKPRGPAHALPDLVEQISGGWPATRTLS